MTGLSRRVKSMVKKSKPELFIFVGPSAAGKDSAAKELANLTNIHMSVSSTTRPKRANELEDIDYHFISKEEFKNSIKQNMFLEYSKFRGWYYGTHLNEVVFKDKAILVLNPQGVRTLIKKYGNKFNLHFIYLVCPLGVRLERSIARERSFKFEFIRRAITDYFDFKHLFNIQCISDNLVCAHNQNTGYDVLIFNTENITSLEVAKQICKEYLLDES